MLGNAPLATLPVLRAKANSDGKAFTSRRKKIPEDDTISPRLLIISLG